MQNEIYFTNKNRQTIIGQLIYHQGYWFIFAFFLLSALANYFDSALLTDVQEHSILISL